MSANTIRFLDAASFDEKAVRAMGLAYDRALRELHDKGQPEVVCDVIAKRIIAAARAGERDSERLCEIALGRKLDGK